jgi:hypothetical protein
MCPKIRCDGESEKFCKIFWELNRALVWLYEACYYYYVACSCVQKEKNKQKSTTIASVYIVDDL